MSLEQRNQRDDRCPRYRLAWGSGALSSSSLIIWVCMGSIWWPTIPAARSLRSCAAHMGERLSTSTPTHCDTGQIAMS